MAVKEIVRNKKAYFNYQLMESFEAGVALLGSEVKSLRAGRCHLKDAYISFRKNQAYLQKAHISPYAKAGENNNHEPERLRKLLLNKKEIDKIQGLVQRQKLTCIPTRIYFSKGKVKIEIALAKGKTQRDKRDTLKRKQDNRKIERALKKKR